MYIIGIGNHKHPGWAPDPTESLSITVHDEETRFARSRWDFVLIQVSLGRGCRGIHGAGIYANIGDILMGSMLPYIAYMDPMGYIRMLPTDFFLAQVDRLKDWPSRNSSLGKNEMSAMVIPHHWYQKIDEIDELDKINVRCRSHRFSIQNLALWRYSRD